MSNSSLYAAEGVSVALLVGGFATWAVGRAAGRGRPGFHLERVLLFAFAIRVVSAAALGLTSFGPSIRGGDEAGFVQAARLVAATPLFSGTWAHALTGHLVFSGAGGPTTESGTFHIFLMALQLRLFGATTFAMRITMATISVIGLGLIAIAVCQLAGPRAARFTAWFLALEPANIFFSTTLHKEPPLYLAEGLVVLGGALIWRRPRVGALLLMVLGCLIATATRPYVGWFLAAGATAVLLHASARGASTRVLWSIGLAALVVGVVAISTPAIVNATSNQSLAGLQNSQNANATDNSNLKLAPVNFSSRGAIVVNLPSRAFDLMFRPFPWQVGDASQQLGVIETLIVLGALFVLVRAIVTRSRLSFSTTWPLVYPALMLLIAYSLAVGNAGTGFRYRTHIIALLVGMAAILRTSATEPTRRPAVRHPGLALGVSASA